MSNRLAAENSPYLLQHAENPVDWYPWGSEALEKAKQEGKPIFLSIGYAACHWCHVMERESFEDPAIAQVMNEHFVNIKVDREERPDLDDIYMQAVVAMTGQGGWPMSVFLTPDGQPFYGGTYFPPVRRYSMPSFPEVLDAVRRAWETDRENVVSQAVRLTRHLEEAHREGKSEFVEVSNTVLDQAAMKLAQGYDWKNGGWGKAPKFPQPMALEFLMRRAARGDRMALDMAVHALDAMAVGGMYDVVGGGFARYSVDDVWLVPHFEKMLYDNAQLALAYLHGWLLTGKWRYREVCERTLEFVTRRLTSPEGGFYASLDADSEGEEGKYYVWTPQEITSALPDEALRQLVMNAYGIQMSGNFEGRTVLQLRGSEEEIAGDLDMSVDDLRAHLAEAHRQMLAFRQQRVPPALDDKCVAAWNGLMLTAFSEAGRYLGERRYVDMAMRNCVFLHEQLRDPASRRLARTWRQGQRGPAAFLQDYAAAGLATLSLYQTQPDSKWFTLAQSTAEEMLDLFYLPGKGFYDTGRDAETLLVRPRDTQDNATPAGSSLATQLLLQLSRLTGDGRYDDIAMQTLSPTLRNAITYPTAFSNWLCAADFAAGPVREVALINPQGGDPTPFTRILWESYRPNVLFASGSPSTRIPPLLADRPASDNRPTAFVCQNFACLQPTTDPDTFRQQLAA